jgi:hypothetical protein
MYLFEINRGRLGLKLLGNEALDHLLRKHVFQSEDDKSAIAICTYFRLTRAD